MDKYTSKCIDGAKSLIEKQVKGKAISKVSMKFSSYSKVYFWANENIAEYLELADISNATNALSVMSSGDQTFNLVTKGIMNIDTFDLNKLTEFYALGIKRAMILKYSYHEFIKVINKVTSKTLLNESDSEELIEIIKGLFPYIEERHRTFWQAIIDYYYLISKSYDVKYNLFDLLCHAPSGLSVYHILKTAALKANNWLLNEKNYNILRSRLANANITFKYANAVDLPNKFSSKYDVLMLSNILDYVSKYFGYNWTYGDLQEYESSLEGLIKENGIIFLMYIFYVNPSNSCQTLFNDSSVALEELTEEKIYLINSPRNKYVPDAMILKRVKKEGEEDEQIHK